MESTDETNSRIYAGGISMQSVHIIYRQYLDLSGMEMVIGGVETYITNLIKVFSLAGYKVKVYQFSTVPFTASREIATIYGVASKKKDLKKHLMSISIQPLVDAAEKNADLKKDIVVFGTEIDLVKNNFDKSIALQHGIGWDVFENDKAHEIQYIKYFVKNSVRAFYKYLKLRYATKVICVDYNFLNWYRTLIAKNMNKLEVIPNFSFIPECKKRKEDNSFSIIFARRFQTYRGTRVFAKAVIEILKKYPDIKITMAGEGPEEAWLHTNLKSYPQVEFTKFSSENSIHIHQKYDLAVVPSTGSEGTSLSLLEAMASGCAVICTNVGGLTNIVIDGFNGVMIKPDSKRLSFAIEMLYRDKELREKLSYNARETIKESFSYEKWVNRWLDVIKNI